ncbi:MAG: DsrH/TusB family sulfur metabolism protein [Nitrospirota bacterium]|jgi:sulfur relay protein TusB/DsrH
MKLGVFVSDYTLPWDTLDRIQADTLGLILVQNGIYHAVSRQGMQPSPLLGKTDQVYVLSEDVETRGIDASSLDAKAKVVTYSDVVDIIMNDFEKIAWMG